MKPMKCPLCPSKKGFIPVTYNSRSEVMLHVRRRHKLQLYHCVECEADFVDEIIHRKFHQDFPYVCSFCPKVFRVSEALYAHVQTQHGSNIGLHPATGIVGGNGAMSTRGEELLRRVRTLGISEAVELVSKDYFVSGTEGGLPVVTVHAITPQSLLEKKFLTRRSFPDTLLRKGQNISHLCTGWDFSYDDLAYQASFDDLNWVYLEPKVNRNDVGAFEMFNRNTLAPKWNEVLVVTVVYYRKREERTAEKIGKAVLLTRNGEGPKVLCFIFPNEVSSKSIWNRCVTLEQFRAEMNQPNLFRDIEGLLDCLELQMLPCVWLRCNSAFLTRTERDAHHKICPIQHDKKALKRDLYKRDIPMPCLNCLCNITRGGALDSHIKSFHGGARSRKKQDEVSTSKDRSRSPHRHEVNSSLETIEVNKEKEDDKSKIIKMIREASLSAAEIQEIGEELFKKSPVCEEQ